MPDSINNLDRRRGRPDVGDVYNCVLILEEVVASAGAGPFSNVLYVDATRGDDGTGTIGNSSKPFLTIQGALDVAVTGSTVNIGPGTYTEQVVVPAVSDIALVGTDATAVIIDGLTASALQLLDPSIVRFTLSNVTLRNSGNDATMIVDGAGSEMVLITACFIEQATSGSPALSCEQAGNIFIRDTIFSAESAVNFTNTAFADISNVQQILAVLMDNTVCQLNISYDPSVTSQNCLPYAISNSTFGAVTLTGAVSATFSPSTTVGTLTTALSDEFGPCSFIFAGAVKENCTIGFNRQGDGVKIVLSGARLGSKYTNSVTLTGTGTLDWVSMRNTVLGQPGATLDIQGPMYLDLRETAYDQELTDVSGGALVLVSQFTVINVNMSASPSSVLFPFAMPTATYAALATSYNLGLGELAVNNRTTSSCDVVCATPIPGGLVNLVIVPYFTFY